MLAHVGLTAGPTEARPLEVYVRFAGDHCDISLAGRQFELRPGSDGGIDDFLRSWRDRRVDINADFDLPYRCLGGLLFALQSAGFPTRGVRFNGLRLNDPRLRAAIAR